MSKQSSIGSIIYMAASSILTAFNSDQKTRPLLSTTKSAKKWKPTEPQAWGTALEMEMKASIAWKSSEFKWRFARSISWSVYIEGNSSIKQPMKTHIRCHSLHQHIWSFPSFYRHLSQLGTCKRVHPGHIFHSLELPKAHWKRNPV